MSTQCPGQTQTGRPCSAKVHAGKTYCIWHDPERKAAAEAARKLGGHNSRRTARANRLLTNGLETLGDLNSVLKVALLDVHRGKLDPRVALAMSALAGRIKEISIGVELEQRIAELQKKTSELAGMIDSSKSA